MNKWIAVPNPMRSDGSFLCIDGPERFYDEAKTLKRLPTAIVFQQLPPRIAEIIAEAHNADIEGRQVEQIDIALKDEWKGEQ